MGLRTRISRERSLGKITLRTVNTPTGANEVNNGGDEDCAIFYFFYKWKDDICPYLVSICEIITTVKFLFEFIETK